MKIREVVFYSVLMVVCSIYIFTATSMPIGSLAAPGPGFLPIVLGSSGLVLSGILFISKLRQVLIWKKTNPSDPQTKLTMSILGSKQVRKVFQFIIVVVVYLLLFKKVSLLACTFIFIVILGKIFELEGWIKPVMVSATFVVAIYLIFVWAFKIKL